MTGTTVPELLAAMATYIGTVPGIRAGIYPPPPMLQASQLPAVVLLWDSDLGATQIAHGGDTQMWTPAIMGQLVVAMEGDLEREIPVVDELVTPLADAFGIDPETGIGVAPDRMTGLSGHVDRCLLTEVRPGQSFGFAGHEYYGANLYFSIKFHRTPEVLP